jgi:hypothetical protein
MKKISNFVFRRKLERKAIRFVAVVFALILAALNLTTTAWSGDIFHFRGNSAIASWSSSNPTTCDCSNNPSCIVTSVFVFAVNRKFQTPPGPGDSSSFADIFISQFDSCTETSLLNVGCFPSVPLADQDFQAS